VGLGASGLLRPGPWHVNLAMTWDVARQARRCDAVVPAQDLSSLKIMSPSILVIFFTMFNINTECINLLRDYHSLHLDHFEGEEN
jgi:hypothetical protein